LITTDKDRSIRISQIFYILLETLYILIILRKCLCSIFAIVEVSRETRARNRLLIWLSDCCTVWLLQGWSFALALFKTLFTPFEGYDNVVELLEFISISFEQFKRWLTKFRGAFFAWWHRLLNRRHCLWWLWSRHLRQRLNIGLAHDVICNILAQLRT
jgi:hypothetical protein